MPERKTVIQIKSCYGCPFQDWSGGKCDHPDFDGIEHHLDSGVAPDIGYPNSDKEPRAEFCPLNKGPVIVRRGDA